MTFRKQLTVLIAEESDIQVETEFYAVDEVKGILDDIESRVNTIKDLFDNYGEWTIEDLNAKLKEVENALSELSNDLY
jgi:methyl-accepting chemotaxis protein